MFIGLLRLGLTEPHRVGAFEVLTRSSLPPKICRLESCYRVGAFEARPIYTAAVGKGFIVFDVSGSLTLRLCLLTMHLDAITYDFLPKASLCIVAA